MQLQCCTLALRERVNFLPRFEPVFNMTLRGVGALLVLALCTLQGTSAVEAEQTSVSSMGEIPVGYRMTSDNMANTTLQVPGGETPAPNRVVQSFCSDRATARGRQQRVFSTSFFGSLFNSKLYFFGIARNAKNLPRMYPNWTMRVYHNMNADQFTWPTLKVLQKVYPHLDLCNASSLPELGNVSDITPTVWRYLPLGDPLVELFVSRDLDSYVIPREKAAVEEWTSSNLTFHVMRDHKNHTQAILGGLWGAKLHDNVNVTNDIFRNILRQARERKSDQEILNSVVWPAITDKTIQHSSFSCEEYKNQGNMLPFPTKRKTNGFVGFEIEPNGLTSFKTIPCPKQCRPHNHQDWKYC